MTWKLIRENQRSHFFFDEAPVGINGLSPKELLEISNEIQNDKLLWIACHTKNRPLAISKDLHGNYTLSSYSNEEYKY